MSEGKLEEPAPSGDASTQRTEGSSSPTLGLAARLQGQAEQASRHFLAELRLNPGDARSAYYLALSWSESGRPEQAGRAAQLAHELDPGHAASAELAASLGRPGPASP